MAADLPRPTVADARERLDAGAGLTKLDLALLLSVSTKTVDRLIAAGKLPAPDMVFNARLLRWSAKVVRPIVDGGGSAK
jgi:hypothetical protein